MEDAGEKLKEIRQVLHELEKVKEQERALSDRIAALVGLPAKNEQRKAPRKTFSASEFARGCGM